MTRLNITNKTNALDTNTVIDKQSLTDNADRATHLTVTATNGKRWLVVIILRLYKETLSGTQSEQTGMFAAPPVTA